MSDVSTLRWQRGLLALCAIGVVFWALSLLQDSTLGAGVGLAELFTSVPFHDAVITVRPDWPAAQAGIKPGDIVDLRAASPENRWRFRNHVWEKDETSHYVVMRGATERRVTLRPKQTRLDLSSWSWYVGALGALIFTGLIAWRRPWMVEARILCLLLIARAVAVCLQRNDWITPWPTLDFWVTLAFVAIANFGTLLLVVYTLRFGQPISTTRKVAVGLAFLIIGFDLIYSTAVFAGSWSGALDLWGGANASKWSLNFWEWLVYWAWPPLVFATAVFAARGRERSLLIWTAALLFFGYLMVAVSIAASTIPALASNQLFFAVLRYVENGTQFLTPFAIGYALLRRSRFSPMTAAAGTMA